VRFVAEALAIAGKDLRIEFRHRTAILTAVAFAVLVLLAVVFAREPGGVALRTLAPTVLWITLAFTTIVILNRAFLLEREHQALETILLTPASRAALYWGKWLANTVLVALVLLIAFPLWALFFEVGFSARLVPLVLVMLLAAAGFTACGTLFAAMTARTRYAELLLPVLLLPFLFPTLVAGASAGTRLLGGRPFEEVAGWLRILVTYDVAFLALASLLFPHVVDE
jgi:heme exporter protein B